MFFLYFHAHDNDIEMKYKNLINKAHLAMNHSYSPYSKFRVGAALLSRTGKIYTGTNIENSSFSLTICAERVAIFKAISEGNMKFEAMVIASDSHDFIPPCGACRQVMLELASDIEVVLTNATGKIMKTNVASLLPYPFTKRFLDKR